MKEHHGSKKRSHHYQSLLEVAPGNEVVPPVHAAAVGDIEPATQ
jgi:hypothetical protein